jgi:hypothetical protein
MSDFQALLLFMGFFLAGGLSAICFLVINILDSEE